MASARKQKRSRAWSYATGERGRNRIRVYEWGSKGIYLDFFELAPEAPGGRRRVRMALGHADREQAKAKADEVALAFRRGELRSSASLTLAMLFDMYAREVTPSKCAAQQAHDRRCFEMFLRFFGSNRKACTLSRIEWDRFVGARRAGAIAPKGPRHRQRVRDRTVQQNLRLLLATLNWATLAGDGSGQPFLERNPLKGLPVPKEESPKRPVVTEEQYQKLREAARAISPRLECLLSLAHETGHRAASIRQLRWSDLDLERKSVVWRGENDKIRFEHTTPLTDEAVAVLQAERSRSKAIGDAWVFASPRDATLCLSRHAVCNLWKRIARKAGLPEGQRYGWHALRRKFANELRTTPLRDLAHLGGWKNPQTIVCVYQQPDEATQRLALANRTRGRAAIGG